MSATILLFGCADDFNTSSVEPIEGTFSRTDDRDEPVTIGSCEGNPTDLTLGYNIFVKELLQVQSGDCEGPAVAGSFRSNGSSYSFANINAGSFFSGDDEAPTALYVEGQVELNGRVKVNRNGFVKLGDPTGLTIYDIDQNGVEVNTRITDNGYDSNNVIELSTKQSEASVLGEVAIDIDAAFEELEQLSSNLSEQESTANFEIASDRKAFINNSADALSVVHVDAFDLDRVQEIKFEFTPTASAPVVINVSGVGEQAVRFGQQLNSANNYVLFNIYEAEKFTIKSGSASIYGTIFAPKVDVVKIASNNIDGQVIAKSFDHKSGEVHYKQFEASILGGAVCASTPTPNPVECNEIIAPLLIFTQTITVQNGAYEGPATIRCLNPSLEQIGSATEVVFVRGVTDYLLPREAFTVPGDYFIEVIQPDGLACRSVSVFIFGGE